MRYVVLLASLMAIAIAPVGAGEALRMRVSPAYSYAPATLVIQLSVEPHAANRLLVVDVESPAFFRSSEIALEGDRAARTSIVRYKSLPAGAYDVHARLVGTDGRTRASETRSVVVMEGGR